MKERNRQDRKTGPLGRRQAVVYARVSSKEQELEAWARHLESIFEGKREQTVVSFPLANR
jgi:hypothetical protein